MRLKYVFLVLCFFGIIQGSRAGYVLISSVDQIPDEGQYLLTTTPSLTEGIMMGNTISNGANKEGLIAGISLPADASSYREWKISVVKNDKGEVSHYEISRNENILGVKADDATDLKVGTDVQWSITPSDKANGGFIIQNQATPTRYLGVFGAENWGNYISPTNAGIYLFKKETVAAPEFLTSTVQFASPIKVELTAETGNTIHYTLDNSAPTEASATYDAPIGIETTTTIKAIAINQEGEKSEIAEQTYAYCPPIEVRVGGADGIGTLYSDYAVTLPEGATVYTISSKDDENGVLLLNLYAEKAGSTLPAGVPFIVQSKSQTTQTFEFSDAPALAVPEYATDLVKGTGSRIPAPTGYRLLGLGYSADHSKFGFYPFVGDYIAANRVFLTLPPESAFLQVKSMSEFVSGEQYVIATESNGGIPAGFHATALNNNHLPAVAVTDESSLYLWVLNRVGSSDKVRIVGEDGQPIASKNSSSTDVGVITYASDNQWKLSFDDSGHCVLVNNNRYLQYRAENYQYFKCYAGIYANPYLFRKLQEGETSQTKGYTLHWGTSTNVTPVAAEPNQAGCYDLQGKKVTDPKRGFYIRDGKKEAVI